NNCINNKNCIHNSSHFPYTLSSKRTINYVILYHRYDYNSKQIIIDDKAIRKPVYFNTDFLIIYYIALSSKDSFFIASSEIYLYRIINIPKAKANVPIKYIERIATSFHTLDILPSVTICLKPSIAYVNGKKTLNCLKPSGNISIGKSDPV